MTDQASPTPPLLDLRKFGEGPGLPALTVAAGRFLAEAAAVCLESQGHVPGVTLAARAPDPVAFTLQWPEVSDQTRRTFNDMQDATEFGACGIAILLVLALTGFTVVERSRKGTGFDYWLGHPTGLPFQNKARLEVSGILRGTEGQIAARMREKLKQTEASDETLLPAYAVVVEFSRPRAEVGKR